MSERLERTLHAYHDGELGWWARTRFEARLRRSPELRAELASIATVGDWVRQSEAPVRAEPDLWEGIAGRLRVVDAAVDADPPARPLSGWRPLAAAAGVAAAVFALFFAIQQPAPGPVPVPIERAAASGAVRYLDTGGEPVWVQDRKDVTIIWLMEPIHDEV